jgi:hypothetical protein
MKLLIFPQYHDLLDRAQICSYAGSSCHFGSSFRKSRQFQVEESLGKQPGALLTALKSLEMY